MVPTGGQVTEEEGFDPCTATVPTVVLAERLAPSCLHGLGLRPSQPYLWITKQPLEDRRVRTANGVAAARPVATGERSWTASRSGGARQLVEVDGDTLQGRLGVPEKGSRPAAARRRPVGGGCDLTLERLASPLEGC